MVFVGPPGGWEVYDLAATAASKSCTQKLREGGISVRMHTGPESCTRRSCMNVAVRLLLWHMSHPVSVWGNPPALKSFSMWGRQCRELMDKTLAWGQMKGNWKCRRTGWGPEALKEMKDVSEKLAPGGGGKGPVPFAPLSANVVPSVVLRCIANPDSGPVISRAGKGKGKGGACAPSSTSLTTLPCTGHAKRSRSEDSEQSNEPSPKKSKLAAKVSAQKEDMLGIENREWQFTFQC